MMLVGSLRIIHERLVVRDVVASVHDGIISCQARVMLTADGATLRIHSRRRESALKPAPSDVLGIQQVTHVLAGHRDLVNALELRIRSHTIVEQRPGIADHRSGSCRVGNGARRTGRLAVGPGWKQSPWEGISGNKIEAARRGRPDRGPPGVSTNAEERAGSPPRGSRSGAIGA